MNALKETTFTVRSLSKKLEVTEQAVRLWITQKKLAPCYKAGRHWLIPESSANKFLEDRSN